MPRQAVSTQERDSGAAAERPAAAAVTPVKLSDLARRKPPVLPPEPPARPAAPPGAAAAPKDGQQERLLRRNGFEVARGMISAAVKSELASCRLRGGSLSPGDLESRILTRISQIEAPFSA